MDDFKSVSYSAGGIVVNKSKVALITSKDLDILKKGWFIPKGRIEKGENSIKTAEREILEETGLKEIKLIKKLGVIKRPTVDIPDELKIIDVFLFTTHQEELNPQEDFTEAKWFDINEVVSKLYTKQEKDFFQEHVNEIKMVNK